MQQTPGLKPVTRPRSAWPERLFYAAAAVLVLVAASILGLKRLVKLVTPSSITHQVLPELKPADHIEAPAGALRDYNVVIITTDTTRADHLGCYGNRGVQTPVLDQLAREGILCAEAITPTPETLPAHSSLMTGLYPHHHGARANGTFKLKEEVSTLAERLKEKGYRTGAAISAFVLDSRFGLDQGFDTYNDDLTKGMKYSAHMFRERAAELTNEPVLQWLRENADQPFFLWVHYFDPHAVYLPPEPFRTQYADNLYDGEIAYADSQIGALLAELKELGVRDKTLVVYTSDHGEGLGEHGEFTHSLLIYDATLHVPLIFNAPAGLPRGDVIQRQTCLIDVVPTVLSLLGHDVPEDVDGVDLTRPWDGQPRPLLIETIAPMVMHGWAPLVGIRRDDYKYILAPTPELYDLKADPSEIRNLHDDRSDAVRELSNELVGHLGQDPYLAARQAIDLKNMELDSQAVAHLAALGYVATAREKEDTKPTLRDPKEMIGFWETVQKAIALQAQGRGREAVPILEAELAEVPRDIFSRSILAGIYRDQGELDRAMDHLQVAASYEDSCSIRLGIAGVHLARGEFDKAEEEIATAQKLEPESAQVYLLRGQIATIRHRDEEAIKLFEKAMAMDPGSTGAAAYNQIGYIHLQNGKLDEARAAFRNAIRIDALDGSAHDGLANILSAEGKNDEAMAELRIALRFNPNQPRALSTLASMLSQKGEQEEAEKLCLRALEISPNFPIAHNNLGLIYRRMGKLDQAEKHYQESIKAQPRLDAAHINLAQLYVRQGKQQEALQEFRAAVRANPRYPNPIALANLGASLFNQGRHAQALRFYLRALQIDPDYALVHKHIASIFTLQEFDRPRRAAFHLRRSLELDPDQPDAEQLRDLLARIEVAAAQGRPEPPLPHDEPAADEELPLDEPNATGEGKSPPASSSSPSNQTKHADSSAASPTHEAAAPTGEKGAADGPAKSPAAPRGAAAARERSGGSRP